MRTVLSFEREKHRLKAGRSAPALAPTRRRPPRREEAAAAGPAVGMFRTTASGEFVEVSPQLAALLGYAGEEELLSANAADLYVEKHDRSRWQALMQAYTGPVAFETALVKYDGSIVWAHITSHAVRDESGRVAFYEGILEDVTARRQAEQELTLRNAALERGLAEATEAVRAAAGELEASRRELSRLYAEMEHFIRLLSHDLQEPLRMVSSFLQLLSQRYRGKLDDEADRFVGYAVGGALRMKTLIGELQGYLRISCGGESMHSVDCGQVFEDAVNALRPLAEETAAGITADELPVVDGDARYLRMVLEHLIGNALKFHGKNPPRVHVSAKRRSGEWLFSVRDQGIGIAPEHSERIFQIFKRLHVSAEYPGTGMGLAVCRKIIEQHGGRIWVESRAGEGATFLFTLPDSDGVRRQAARQTSSQATSRARAVL